MPTVNCNAQWRGRTAIYSAAPRTRAAHGASVEKRAADARAQALRDGASPRAAERAAEGAALEIPKTTGFTQCAACGLKAFFGCDGAPMIPCTLCAAVDISRAPFYCDETCMACDQPFHSLYCNNANKGKELPKTVAEPWIQTRQTWVVRRALRRRPKPSAEEVRARRSPRARAPSRATPPSRALRGKRSPQL